MQRMKLNFLGQSTGDYKNTCKIASAAAVVMFVLIVILGGTAGYVGVVGKFCQSCVLASYNKYPDYKRQTFFKPS